MTPTHGMILNGCIWIDGDPILLCNKPDQSIEDWLNHYLNERREYLILILNRINVLESFLNIPKNTHFTKNGCWVWIDDESFLIEDSTIPLLDSLNDQLKKQRIHADRLIAGSNNIENFLKAPATQA